MSAKRVIRMCSTYEPGRGYCAKREGHKTPCVLRVPHTPAHLPYAPPPILLPREAAKQIEEAGESMIRAYVRHRRGYGWCGDESDVNSVRKLRAALALLREALGEEGR